MISSKTALSLRFYEGTLRFSNISLSHIMTALTIFFVVVFPVLQAYIAGIFWFILGKSLDHPMTFSASVLLIAIPVLCGLALTASALPVINKFLNHRALKPMTKTLVAIFLSGGLMFGGSLFGLILSIQINHFVFNYEILEKALPQGYYYWGPISPVATFEFIHYWRFTAAIMAILGIYISFLNAKKHGLLAK